MTKRVLSCANILGVSADGARGQGPLPSPDDRDVPPEARRFDRARQAQSRALLEDYTELIAELTEAHGEARITDIAARLGVAHPTATKAVARLKREGLAVSRPYRGVFLTPAGQAMAEAACARHRVVVDLLRALGVPHEAAETDAEGIEHHVSDVTLQAFAAFLADRDATPPRRA